MNGNKQSKIRKLTDAIGRDVCIDTLESFGLHMDSAGVLTVKGCCRVSLCEDSRIVLHTERGPIGIRGAALQMLLFSPQETQVGGKIETIGFPDGEIKDGR